MRNLPTITIMLLFSNCLLAHTVHFWEFESDVRIRSGAPTMLKFEKPPVSTSCQPASIRFELLDRADLSLFEREKLPPHQREKEDVGPTEANSILRATAESGSGNARCSIYLGNGEEVAVNFILTPGLARPYIEFKKRKEPVAAASGSSNSEAEEIRSLILGRTALFKETTPKEKPSDSEEEVSRTIYQEFSSKNASYTLLYSGVSVGSSAWVLEAKLKKKAHYEDLLSFANIPGLKLRYSAATPQKESYRAGETIKIYITAERDLGFTSLRQGAW